jgi:hypothetical protein
MLVCLWLVCCHLLLSIILPEKHHLFIDRAAAPQTPIPSVRPSRRTLCFVVPAKAFPRQAHTCCGVWWCWSSLRGNEDLYIAPYSPAVSCQTVRLLVDDCSRGLEHVVVCPYLYERTRQLWTPSRCHGTACACRQADTSVLYRARLPRRTSSTPHARLPAALLRCVLRRRGHGRRDLGVRCVSCWLCLFCSGVV